MPHVDGYVSIREIRRLLSNIEAAPTLRIVALTGHVELEYVKKAMDHGFDRVLAKPLNIKDIAEELLGLRLIDEIPACARR